MLDLTGRYCARAISPDGWLASWNDDPVLLAFLGLALVGAGALPGPRRRAAWGAIGVLAVAFVSPLCALGAALFAARAAHHLLIVGAAAPLFALALPRAPRVAPAAALLGSTALLWGWYLPAAYDAALTDVVLYWAMQVSLLGSGVLYWAALRAAPPPVAAALVVGGVAQMGLLAAILSFAPRPLYIGHLATTVAYGIGPLADQKLGGLLMWTTGMIPYALAGWLVARAGWERLGVERAAR